MRPGRSLIKEAFADITRWPKPDITVFTDKYQNWYLARVHAVELYAAGKTYSEIFRQTGLNEKIVSRCVERCQLPDGRGWIVGFFACLPKQRLVPYRRKKLVVHVEAGRRHGGCAGALGQLLERFPQVLELIEKELFEGERLTENREPVVSFSDLTRKVIRFLRKLGFTDDQWPLNTQSRGFESFRMLYHEIGEANGVRWVKARGGKRARGRLFVGRAIRPLVRAIRAYTFVQLDFHKVDTACTVVIEHEDGTRNEVAVQRFYIGFLVEELKHPVIGAFLTLEVEPSAESGLETISMAIVPASRDASGDPWSVVLANEKLLPNLAIPELEGQCFAAIRVDNGWFSIGTELIDRVIDYLGAAMIWGPAYSWWTRPIVEMVIGEVTRLGAQRMPSTFGNGPEDPKVSDAIKKAMSGRVRLADIGRVVARAIGAFNARPSEGYNHGLSPHESLVSAIANPQSGFVWQKLPKPEIELPRICWTHITRRIGGDLDKGVRPYIQFLRGRYTNDYLENAWHLIGQWASVWIYNRDCRLMDATVIDTGENIGRLVVGAPYDRTAHSIRMRQLVNQAVRSSRQAYEGEDPVDRTQQERLQRVRAERGAERRRTRGSRDALDAARHARYQGYQSPSQLTRSELPDDSGPPIPSAKLLIDTSNLPPLRSVRKPRDR